MHKHYETSFFIFPDGSAAICPDHVELIESVTERRYCSDEIAYEEFAKIRPFIRGYYFENSHEIGFDFRFMKSITVEALVACRTIKRALDRDYGVERTVIDGSVKDI